MFLPCPNKRQELVDAQIERARVAPSIAISWLRNQDVSFYGSDTSPDLANP
jgi:hypothetical protein